jgi:acyl phosphate:glycerol-3-phosphate acyltransferase
MQQTSLNLAWLLLAAYLLGSIPFGVIFAWLFGSADVRKSGSGNIGATNVARVAGPLAGILTLVFDTGKGAAAVLLAARIAHESAAWMMLAGLVALVGHCFPVWLKFKGGKGVAAALGVFLALCPAAALTALLLFMIVVAMWRYVSLGSIAAAAGIPLLMYFLWAPRHAPPLIITFGSLAAAVLVVYKHDGNIQRLIQGEEPKYSFRKKKDVA